MATIPLDKDTRSARMDRRSARMDGRSARMMDASRNDRAAALDPEQAWQQVMARDASADGCFVYAVESTGIFCRPSCPSRRPARHRVRFFPTAAAALGAGYRACRRCQPAGERAEAEMVRNLCAYLDRHLDRAVTLAQLGRITGLSSFTVQRMFERVLGTSPRQYQIERRHALLRERLRSAASVTAALHEAGFSSASRMYEGAEGRLGMAPERLRRGGEGEQVRFFTAPCPLGRVLVAATARGLCAVSLGEDDRVMEQELRSRFARATVAPAPADDLLLGNAARAIVAAMGEHPAAVELPLDLRATAFEQRVWRLLRTIPRGTTRSYSEVAAALGMPRAVRAVARACGRNPVAVLVPCHRVVGKDGRLTGYRWGIERKRRLLDAERGPIPDAERGPAPDAERGPTPDAERGPNLDAERGPTPDAERGPAPDAERGSAAGPGSGGQLL